MSGITVLTTQFHIPKYLQVQQEYCENLIQHRIVSVYVSPSCSLILLTLTQMEVACSWHVTSTKIAQQVNFVSYAFTYLPNGCVASLSVLFFLHVSFTLRGSVFSAVKEKQVLLLADVQSQLCEWVKLQQRCRLGSTVCSHLSFT